MSKARIHSDLPKLASERPFAQKLLALEFPDNNQPHLWFAKLPGMKDIDAIIWLPRTGLFIVEMKSWPLSGIHYISTQRFEVQSFIKHSTKKSPWEQVHEAEQQFRNRLLNDSYTNRKLRNPWTSPIVALYRISRGEFESRFRGTIGSPSEANFKQLISRSTVFEEDLDSGEDLIERLQYCRYNPIFGDGPDSGPVAVDNTEAVKILDAFINLHLLATRPPSAYDKERLKELERVSARRLKTVSWGQSILCTGYAGTGKTLLGLQAALLRLEPKPDSSFSGEAGLFICFNKVLASDIKRLTALSPKFRQIQFDVFDIFELLKFFAERCGVPISSGGETANKWAKKLLSEILERKDIETKRLLESWSLIIVDESQDLEDWAWELLDRLSKGSNNLFVIDGKHQLLYRNTRSSYLDLIYEVTQQSENKTNFVEQRRVFRTTDTTFLISQLFNVSST